MTSDIWILKAVFRKQKLYNKIYFYIAFYKSIGRKTLLSSNEKPNKTRKFKDLEELHKGYKTEILTKVLYTKIFCYFQRVLYNIWRSFSAVNAYTYVSLVQSGTKIDCVTTNSFTLIEEKFQEHRTRIWDGQLRSHISIPNQVNRFISFAKRLHTLWSPHSLLFNGPW